MQVHVAPFSRRTERLFEEMARQGRGLHGDPAIDGTTVGHSRSSSPISAGTGAPPCSTSTAPSDSWSTARVAVGALHGPPRGHLVPLLPRGVGRALPARPARPRRRPRPRECLRDGGHLLTLWRGRVARAGRAGRGEAHLAEVSARSAKGFPVQRYWFLMAENLIRLYLGDGVARGRRFPVAGGARASRDSTSSCCTSGAAAPSPRRSSRETFRAASTPRGGRVHSQSAGEGGPLASIGRHPVRGPAGEPSPGGRCRPAGPHRGRRQAARGSSVGARPAGHAGLRGCRPAPAGCSARGEPGRVPGRPGHRRRGRRDPDAGPGVRPGQRLRLRWEAAHQVRNLAGRGSESFGG